MICGNIIDKKGTFIGEEDFHREVKLFASPRSEINLGDFAVGITVIGTGKKHEEHKHEGNKEFMLIFEGEGILISDDKRIKVKRGDYFGFDFNEPHGFENTGNSELKIFWIYAPPGLAEEKFLIK